MKSVCSLLIFLAGEVMYGFGLSMVQTTWGLGATWVVGFLAAGLFCVGLVTALVLSINEGTADR